ncbi:MAG: aspartate 1-decarboxylase [Holophagales bacterium]|jgi:aspartate 1-decarboxylase|nr:aspartate 1-decarboxylase [Holophagales bacterium]
MLRQFMLGKIHRCTVTRADLDYVGSVTIDSILMEAAGFLENEKVEIYNIANGSRFATYVIPGVRESGEIGINGAAAHLAKAGDLVILVSYGWLTPDEIDGYAPKVVFVDARNRVTSINEREQN